MSSINEKKLPKFEEWLRAAGAEILPTTNEYEVLRFRSSLGVGVVYRGKKGITFNSDSTEQAFVCFTKGKKWDGKGKPTKRINGSKLKRQAVERDGCGCFYCDRELKPEEMTLEHLIPVNQGGKNNHGNTVIACQPCNLKAGHLSLVEKIKLRDDIRKNPSKED